MIRGTTPVIKLTLPEEIDWDVLYITFKQGDTNVLEKTLSDVEIDGKTIYLLLTQAETLAFDRSNVVWVQLRGKVGDTAYASKVMRVSVSDILKGGEI